MDIRGDLDNSIIMDVIGLLSSIKVSGTLTLDGEKKVDIYFRNGSIIGGASDFNEDFIELIVAVNSGDYYFSGTTVCPREYSFTLDVSHDEFLHKISKRMETPEVSLDIYQDDMEFQLAKVLNLEDLDLDSEEWRIIAILSEKRSVLEIRTTLGFNIQTVSKILFGLENVEIIKRVRKEKMVSVGASLIKRIRQFLERFGG